MPSDDQRKREGKNDDVPRPFRLALFASLIEVRLGAAWDLALDFLAKISRRGA
jgi:hypothetical protein